MTKMTEAHRWMRFVVSRTRRYFFMDHRGSTLSQTMLRDRSPEDKHIILEAFSFRHHMFAYVATILDECL
jgi:hypothetical protein